MSAGREAFDRLFIAWRFGDPVAATQAIALAEAMIAGGSVDSILMLRVGILLWETDRPLAEHWIDRARQAGADIPRAYSRIDERRTPLADTGQAPAEQLDVVVVSEPSRRDFAAPEGASDHPAFSSTSPIVPPLNCLSLPHGTITVDARTARPEVYVHDRDGRLVVDWSSGAMPVRGETLRCDGPLVLLDDAFGSFNVCHALFDKFPRLAVYERLMPGRRLTGLMFRDHPYYREVLAYLGHDFIASDSKMGAAFGGTTTHMLSNHHRGEVRHPGFRAAPWAIDFIRDRFQAPMPGSRRLFISRRDSSERLINADAVEDIFARRGFEIVTMTGRPFAEQRALFQSAHVIAGAHGAGLANLVFAAPGSQVFEIIHPIAGTAAFGLMAQALGLRYRVFAAEDAEFTVQPGASYDTMLNARPMRVDTARLAEDVDRLLG